MKLASVFAALRTVSPFGATARKQSHRSHETPGLEASWSAWRNGNFALASQLAGDAVASDESAHLQVLSCAAMGKHTAALAYYLRISLGYRRLSELDEAVLWAHVQAQDISGAKSFAEGRRLTRSAATREQLRIATP